MCTRLCHQMHQILLMLHQLSGFRMNLHKSLTTFSLPPARSHRSIFEPPQHQTQTEKFMERRRNWIYKNGSIKIARIGAWSDHPSALGNVFSVHNAEQFSFSVVQIFKSSDGGPFWGKFVEPKVSSPLSAICSGCHNGFVRL